MGLLSLFGKGPLSEKKIAKVAKLAANPFAQPDVRMQQMQRLLQDGSDGALRGLLRRFAANAQGHIADEDEKKWLEDALVGCGDKASPALRDYIGSETKLTYALRAYRRIVGDSEALAFFLGVLERYGPDDYRTGEEKLQLMWQFTENLGDTGLLARLAPFLQDHSDDVAWAVLDLIESAADKNLLSDDARAATVERMLALVTASEVSARIARRTADVLANREWALPDGPEALASALDDEYFLDKKRFVRRRGKKSVA